MEGGGSKKSRVKGCQIGGWKIARLKLETSTVKDAKEFYESKNLWRYGHNKGNKNTFYSQKHFILHKTSTYYFLQTDHRQKI